MKPLAIGLAAALGLALPVSADTISTRMQFAQATQGGSGGGQSGGGAATTQQSGGGSATTPGTAGAQGGPRPRRRCAQRHCAVRTAGTAGATRQTEGRREGSRTNIRANVRVGGGNDVRSRTTTRTRFGVRTRVGGSDDVTHPAQERAALRHQRTGLGHHQAQEEGAPLRR